MREEPIKISLSSSTLNFITVVMPDHMDIYMCMCKVLISAAQLAVTLRPDAVPTALKEHLVNIP